MFFSLSYSSVWTNENETNVTHAKRTATGCVTRGPQPASAHPKKA